MKYAFYIKVCLTAFNITNISLRNHTQDVVIIVSTSIVMSGFIQSLYFLASRKRCLSNMVPEKTGETVNLYTVFTATVVHSEKNIVLHSALTSPNKSLLSYTGFSKNVHIVHAKLSVLKMFHVLS